LPSVKQVVLSGTHLLPVHLPLQHWPLLAHVALSAVHESWQTLPSQLTEQQSVFAEHEVPAGEHAVGLAAHVIVPVSQIIEQQSVFDPHPCPNV
jgi:hypothetical protein